MAAGWWFGPWRANGPAVTFEVMAPGPVTLVLAVSGKVAPRDQVQIRSAVSATLLEVLAVEGLVVQPGDVLARLDPSQQEAIVRQAASALGQGQVLQQQAELAYLRNQELGNLVPRSRLEDSRLALDGAAQDVARLTALLDQATIQLGRFTLRAPIAGTITVRSVDPGQLVDPATALFTLADMTELLIETDVDEAYATRIAVGQEAAVRLVGGRGILEGTVIFVSPRVDPATGGLAVKLGLADPLRAPIGLTVTANIVVGRETALTVPRTALQGDAVFLLVGNRAVLRPVMVTDWPAARLIVTEGLAPGDRVITDSTGLSDGLAVDAGEP
ncbi:efflux RND transporter periplasmic adaptor subunit [Rhodobacter sp. SY28-1]|uniref:efflux RND transporter periplasmic adaptor subunit n=1 Tax=Rhodobacter sp. SY28-1 TaxID=2562317 RepID=UPI00148514F5|nr:efflux RND transporter periplasmic adaptor subunit [Rhodobacter sp. SY28-1]